MFDNGSARKLFESSKVPPQPVLVRMPAAPLCFAHCGCQASVEPPRLAPVSWNRATLSVGQEQPLAATQSTDPRKAVSLKSRAASRSVIGLAFPENQRVVADWIAKLRQPGAIASMLRNRELILLVL